MTDLEFLQFIRECTLSNEDIAACFNMATPSVRKWRNGERLPHESMRKHIVRELSILEHTRLSEQIQAYEAKRQQR